MTSVENRRLDDFVSVYRPGESPGSCSNGVRNRDDASDHTNKSSDIHNFGSRDSKSSRVNSSRNMGKGPKNSIRRNTECDDRKFAYGVRNIPPPPFLIDALHQFGHLHCLHFRSMSWLHQVDLSLGVLSARLYCTQAVYNTQQEKWVLPTTQP